MSHTQHNDGPLRTACYGRFSSDMQRETSIEDQVRECREYARRHGWQWQDCHVYSDAAISGSSMEGRPGLKALLAAATTTDGRPFDVLLVDDSSRIARDMPDAMRIMQTFRFAGVRVVYISQGIDTDNAQAETLVAVHGIVDALYLQEMAAKIRRGLRGRVQRGLATGSKTYGYCTMPVPDPIRPGEFVGRSISIHEQEAEVVRQVFQWYAEGVTVPQILKRLVDSDAPPPTGPRSCGAWKRGALLRLLKNEKYLGQQIWGRRQGVRKPGTRKIVYKPVPRNDWATLPRPDLRIIGDELWHRARLRREGNAKLTEPRRHRGNLISGRVGALHGKALFTGLMTCGVCGASISVVNSRTVKGITYSYYGCYDAHRNGIAGCMNRTTARVEHADAALLSALQAQIIEPSTVRDVTAQVSAAIRKLADRRPAELAAAGKRRAEAGQKVQHLITAIESGVSSSSLLAQLHTREQELAALDAEVRAHESAPATKHIEVAPVWVKQKMANLVDRLTRDPAATKAELAQLGVAFVVMPVSLEGAAERGYLRAEGVGDFAAAAFGAHDLLRPR